MPETTPPSGQQPDPSTNTEQVADSANADAQAGPAPAAQYDAEAYQQYYANYQQHYQAAYAQQVPPAKKGGWFGKSFLAGLGFTLGVSIIGFLAQIPMMLLFFALIGAGSSIGGDVSATDKPLYGSASATKQIHVVPVTGVILGASEGNGSPFSVGTYGYDIAQVIDDIDADKTEGLVLELNTPGGTIHGSKAIADAADRYRERTGKKVTAFVQGLSASGGMYAMATADEIIADHGSLIGSIGVVMGPLPRYEGVTSTDNGILPGGVTAERITEEYFTAGKGKDFGNPYRAMSDEERSHYQKQIDVSYDAFVKHVATGRNIPEAKIRDEFGAYIFSDTEAVKVGLADQILGRNKAYDRILDKAGLNKDSGKLVKAKTNDDWIAQLFGITIPDGLLPAARALGIGEPASTNISPWTPGVKQPHPGAVANVEMCQSRTQVMAYHGNLQAVCGS